MDYVNYKDRLYPCYENKEEFLEMSGLKTDRLIRHSQIALGGDYERANVVGKYYVPTTIRCDKYFIPIMPILKYTQAKVPEIETPWGWARVYRDKLSFINRETDRDIEFDFIASFILTGDLIGSFRTTYHKSNPVEAIKTLLKLLEKHGLRERIITFMKENNIKSIFEANGMSLSDLASGWAKSLKEDGKPKDYKEAIEFMQAFDKSGNKPDVTRQLPTVNESKQLTN